MRGPVRRRARGSRLLHALVALVVAAPVGALAASPAAAALAAPVLVNPATGSTVGADAVLSWQPVTGASGYRVQLTDDPTFAFRFWSVDTAAPSYEHDDYFDAGAYHWRVAALDGSTLGAWSTGSFQVARTDVPDLLTPDDGASFEYPSDPPVLSWMPALYGPYSVEVSGAGGNTGTYVAANTTYSILEPLLPGSYTWRVRPLQHGGMPWSASRTFTVAWEAETPTLVTPNGTSSEYPVLDWEPIPGIGRYDVQVASSPNFPVNSTTTSQTDRTTHLLGRTDQTRDRYWRVRGRFGGNLLSWSAARSVTHDAWSDAPTDLWPSSGSFDDSPTLRWSPVEFASMYEIQLASTAAGLGTFPNTCRVYVNAASLGTNEAGGCGVLGSVRGGTVHWRVRGLETAVGAATPWSPVATFSFSVEALDRLAAPVVAEPLGPDDCVDVATCLGTPSVPMLSWEPVEDADFYRVQLSGDAHLQGNTWDTWGTTFVPWVDGFDIANTTRISWQVVACNANGPCPEWTPPTEHVRHFLVRPPAVQIEATTGQTLTGEVRLQFSLPMPAAPAAGQPWPITQRPWGTTVEVDDASTFAAPALFTIGVAANEVTLPPMPDGPMHWRASYGDVSGLGQSETSSYTNVFAASTKTPANGTVVEAPAWVSWDPVPGAATYAIEVDRNGWKLNPGGPSTSWTGVLVAQDFIPGTVGWRVTPIDAAGHRGSPLTGTLVVEPQNPAALSPSAGASVPAGSVAFAWAGTGGVSVYRLEVSADATFQTILHSTATQRTRYVPTVSLPAGVLYWRVRVQGGQGDTLGTSGTRSLTVTADPPSPTPSPTASPTTAPTSPTAAPTPTPAPDTTPPAGSIAIAGGAAYSKTAALTISVAASDGGSGLAKVALSNDGTNWTTRTYGASQSWTLPATNGTRRVYAKWQDKAGNWSAAKSDTIVLDTVAPTATVPRRGFVGATTISANAITTRIPWSGADATSGIARYELQHQVGTGAWVTVSTALTSPTANRALATEQTHRFRVRAIDKAGNAGAWVSGDTFRVSRFSEGNTRITYSGTWAVSKSTAFWGGQAKASSRLGARATVRFTGRSVAWVASTGPTRGKAEVYVNGSRVATVDLYAATGVHRRVVWVGSYSTAVARTISIRVLGTSRRPRVDLDAFVTAN